MAGRPKSQIDEEQVRALAEIQCSYEEIAAVLKTTRQTLQNRFREVVEDGWKAGKTGIRREQMKLAMGGNVTMLIWLGKQFLGQADKVENENVNHNVEQLDDATLLARGRELAARIGTQGAGAIPCVPTPEGSPGEVPAKPE